jgi:hypothetical protein
MSPELCVKTTRDMLVASNPSPVQVVDKHQGTIQQQHVEEQLLVC